MSGKFFTEVMEQVDQRGCGCPIQVGWGCGQHELVWAARPMAGSCSWMVFKVSSNKSHPVLLWSLSKLISHRRLYWVKTVLFTGRIWQVPTIIKFLKGKFMLVKRKCGMWASNLSPLCMHDSLCSSVFVPWSISFGTTSNRPNSVTIYFWQR